MPARCDKLFCSNLVLILDIIRHHGFLLVLLNKVLEEGTVMVMWRLWCSVLWAGTVLVVARVIAFGVMYFLSDHHCIIARHALEKVTCLLGIRHARNHISGKYAESDEASASKCPARHAEGR